MRNFKSHFFLLSIGLLFFFGCSDDEAISNLDPSLSFESGPNLILNPTGYAPLSARLSMNMNIPINLELRVMGKNGQASDLVKRFNFGTKQYNVPVLGLYPSSDNQVEVTFLELMALSWASSPS